VIRAAVLEDVPRLVELGRALLQTAYGGVFSDAPDILAGLMTGLVTGDQSTVLVLDGDAGVMGAIGLIAQPHFASGDLMAAEIFWYVDPLKRGAGVRLLREAERWARAHGALALQMVAPNARVATLYERLGYALMERSYLRRFDAA